MGWHKREGRNMTTKNSPRRVLEAQARKIAATLKAAERGDPVEAKFAEKVAEARAGADLTIGVVMDDKLIKLTMNWPTIRDTTESGLAEYIFGLMREERRAAN